MLRRLPIVVLLLIVVIVIAADRVGDHVATNVLADSLQTDEHFPDRPATTIDGIPFLTQAFSGKYRDVSVIDHSFVTTDGVHVDTLSAYLHDVHIPFSKALHGSVARVPIDEVDGSVFVTFAEINRYLAVELPSVTVAAKPGGALRVSWPVTHGSRTVNVQGTATVSLAGPNMVLLNVGKVRATPVNGHLPKVSKVQPFTLYLPLRQLPFRIALQSVHAQPGGVTATGASTNVVLGS